MKENVEGDVHSGIHVDHTDEQQTDETVRLPLLSRGHQKSLQAYRSHKNNEITGHTYESSLQPQVVKATTVTSVVGTMLTDDIASTPPQVPDTPSDLIKTKSNVWGWLPVLSLTSATGVLLVALAANAGRFGILWADPLFWCGLLVLFVPIAVRIMSLQPARRERIALLLLLGGGTYLFRFLNYPLNFAYTDEFIHWRGAIDIGASGHLFQINQLNPVASFYPGMEIVTNAISSLTGLSIFAAGSIVLVVGGLVLVLSLYLFFEHLSDSARVAGIATLLYMANPGWFSDTQFAYESLALPLAMIVLLAITRRSYMPAGRRGGLVFPIWLGLAATVITHHLTSYVLEGFLLLWSAVFLLLWLKARPHKKHIHPGPREAVLVGLVLTVAWMAFTEWRVVPYLGKPLANTIIEFLQIPLSKETIRPLFQDGSGFTEPLWERAMGFASTGLVSLGLLFGLFQLWRHTRYRTHALVLALAVAALAYPITQLARVTSAGTNTAIRAPVFLFVAVAFVLALGISRWLAGASSRVRLSAIMSAITVIFIGGWVIGTAPLWYRLPGPYLVSADHRSIDPEGINAAQWTLLYLGPGQHIASDRTNNNLLATFGDQKIIASQDVNVEVAAVFVSPQFGPITVGILKYADVQYLLVDDRLSTALPRMGTYFDRLEPNALRHTRPLDLAALTKFDHVQNVSRIYDSGDIVIYDVEAIINSPSVPPTPKTPCVPLAPAGVSPSSPKLARFYNGTIYNVSNNEASTMFLSGIQQRMGGICGFFSEDNVTGSFNGYIAADGHVQFKVINHAGQVLFTLDGFWQPDGTISGDYCRVEAGHCSAYGIWSLSPAT